MWYGPRTVPSMVIFHLSTSSHSGLIKLTGNPALCSVTAIYLRIEGVTIASVNMLPYLVRLASSSIE